MEKLLKFHVVPTKTRCSLAQSPILTIRFLSSLISELQ